MKSNNQYLFFIFVGIAIVVFSWVFLVPKIGEIAQLRETIAQERVRQTQLQSKLNDLQNLNEADLNEKEILLLRAVPSEKDFATVVGIIEKTASDNNLTLIKMQFNPGLIVFDKKQPVVYKLGFNGQISDITNFVSRIESVLPMMKIADRVDLLIQSSSSELTIGLFTSALALPKTLGTIDAVVPKLTTEEEKSLVTISKYDRLQKIIVPLPAGKPNPFSF
ncbi:MAG: hypothetical protein Q7S03_00470 [bacterium]|nr:hypothetical protein [bacterium]